jgi:hypothetical protein
VAREEANENHPAAKFRALRDALGVVRALYAVTRDKARRRALEEAGRHLTHAVEMTRKHPGTLGYQSVPMQAGWAFGALASVTWSREVVAIIEATRRRVDGTQRGAHEAEERVARRQSH